jgi:hypothetical protein
MLADRRAEGPCGFSESCAWLRSMLNITGLIEVIVADTVIYVTINTRIP